MAEPLSLTICIIAWKPVTLLMVPVVPDAAVLFSEPMSILQWPETIHAGLPCSSFWILEISPHLKFWPPWFVVPVALAPAAPVWSPDGGGLDGVSCASAGTALTNMAPRIAKEAMNAAVVRVVFITHG